MQSDCEIAPAKAWRPAAHEYEHAVLPVTLPEKRPGGQSSQAVAASLSWSLCPAAQAVHSVEPLAANEPAAQLSHAERSRSAEYCPGKHASHRPVCALR